MNQYGKKVMWLVKMRRTRNLSMGVQLTLFVTRSVARAQNDPLSSWNDGAAKKTIFSFVKTTTHMASTGLVQSDTHVGTFSDALMAEAQKSGWIVISMRKDWKRIFPFEK